MGTLFISSYIVLWIVVICLSFLVLLVYRQFGLVYLKTSEGVSRGGLKIGSTVQDLSFKNTFNNEVKLSQYKDPVVLLFTSPSCGPCKKLLSNLNDLIIEFPKLNILVFSIDTKKEDSLPNLRCPVIPLEDRKLFEEVFKGEVTPFGFLLDENRKVVSKGVINDNNSIKFLFDSSKQKTLKDVINQQTAV
jgi:thiol-disulfide isomerase/thioredoxin